MKKAQILSAIALAFALGVVAPVAGVNAIDPRADVTAPDEEKDTATVAEVNNTIKSIKAQPEYQAYVALNDANKDTAAYTDEATQQAAIAKAYNDYTGDTYDGADTYAATLAAAKGVKNYDKWVALVNAVEAADNGATSDKEKAQAIISAGEALGYTFTDIDEADWTATLGEIKTKIGADAAYGKAKNFVNAVSGAEKALAASNTSITNLKNALAGVKVDARDIETAAADAAPITALKALAAAQLATTRGAAYVKLIGAVDTAKADADDLKANYTLIESLKADYKAAAGADLVVVDTPTDPTTPGEDGDTDTDKDPSAPGTGVLSSADGNAATTVSIVAGLATALTALGAGVVAYRSARRSSEK